MATETEPTLSEIDIRWELANYGRPTRYSNSEEIFLTITKRHARADAALEEIAAMLCQDGVWPEEKQGEGDPVEGDSLMDLTGEAWEAIEKLLKAWAARAPERRTRIVAQRAAEKADKAAAA